MAGMEAIVEGSERLDKFREKVHGRVLYSLDKVIASLDAVLATLSPGGGEEDSDWRTALEGAREATAKHGEGISTRMNQYHEYVSKLIRLVDKQVASSSTTTTTTSNDHLPFFPRAVHLQTLGPADPYLAFIVRHLAWYGYRDAALAMHFSLSLSFSNTTTTATAVDPSCGGGGGCCGGVRLADAVLSRAEQHHMDTVSPVTAGIRCGDFGALQRWLAVHAAVLGADTTRLLRFEMTACQYLSLVEAAGARGDDVEEALTFVRAHLSAFHEHFSVRIGELVALLLWKGGATAAVNNAGATGGSRGSEETEGLGGAATGQYVQLSPGSRTEALCILVLRASARMHDMPPSESSLQTLVGIGALVESVLARQAAERDLDLGPFQTEGGLAVHRGGDVDTDAEIPVEMDLPGCYRYHSTFSCPVSWARASHHDPPVLLTCGHAVLRSTALAMPRHTGNKVECPTCYNRTTVFTDLIELVI